MGFRYGLDRPIGEELQKWAEGLGQFRVRVAIGC